MKTAYSIDLFTNKSLVTHTYILERISQSISNEVSYNREISLFQGKSEATIQLFNEDGYYAHVEFNTTLTLWDWFVKLFWLPTKGFRIHPIRQSKVLEIFNKYYNWDEEFPEHSKITDLEEYLHAVGNSIMMELKNNTKEQE